MTTVGCNTYNKDNKENKDNENNYVITSFGHEADASSKPTHLAQGQSVSRQGLLDPSITSIATEPLNDSEVKSSILQFIDNGEKQRQRYKVKIRLNLYPEGDVEFIASVSKSIQDFKRHIPGPNRLMILELARDIRHMVKKKYDAIPYIGKFHLKAGRVINIEPDTLVAVWYNQQDAGWEGIVKIQNWEHKFDLCTDRLTAAQTNIGVKGQWVYRNPQYDKTVRPLTWAQRRSLGI